MSGRTAPLPKSALDALNELNARFCPAEGPDFLRCGRASGHDGAHYDVLRRVDWSTEPSTAEEKKR